MGKNSVSWARSALFHIYIVYQDKLNFQMCKYAQKQQICRENSKYAPDGNCVSIFAFAERLPTSATLVWIIYLLEFVDSV